MNDFSRTIGATVAGAALGGLIGYLFFTTNGRVMRRQLEPTIDDLAREFAGFRTTVRKAAGVANDGWRLLTEMTDAIGEESSRRYAPTHQNSPF